MNVEPFKKKQQNRIKSAVHGEGEDMELHSVSQSHISSHHFFPYRMVCDSRIVTP